MERMSLKKLTIEEMEQIEGGSCGQAVADCITDAYSNHGWVSVWAWVQSVALPPTAYYIAAACTAKNC